MSIQEKPRKAVVSVVEMSSLLNLSKSRFYALIQAGIFPRPVRNQSCKRPVFDLDLQRKCLDIRQTGIGCNGQPVLFNRKARRPAMPKSRQDRPALTEEQAELMVALKSLGLNATADEILAALQDLYPNGLAGVDQGEVVRQIFLKIRK